MAQIQSPETYADGQQVTAARLNNQTNGAILLPGVITDQTALAAGTVATGDGLIVHDASASALRKTTAGDLLGSGVPITTGAITGSTGADLVITPAAGQKVDIAGNIEVDDIAVTDDATVAGDLTVTGSSTLTGNVIADNGFTSNGLANFTGTLQVNGTVGYALTEVVEETITTYTTASLPASWTTAWTSASYVKPAGEIWVIEACFNWQRNVTTHNAIRLRQTSSSTDLFGLFDIEGAGSTYIHHEQAVFKYVVPASTTFTSTFTMDAIASAAGYSFELGCTTYGTAGVLTGVTIPSSKFRIYKYKTA